jgi:hypothetical protein
VVQGGGVAGGSLDAEAEQVADLAGVSAGGVGFVEDAVFAHSLDAAGDVDLELDSAVADGAPGGRRCGSEPYAPWRAGAFDAAVFAQVAPLAQTRLALLSEITGYVDFLFLDEPVSDEASWAKAMKPGAVDLLRDRACCLRRRRLAGR